MVLHSYYGKCFYDSFAEQLLNHQQHCVIREWESCDPELSEMPSHELHKAVIYGKDAIQKALSSKAKAQKSIKARKKPSYNEMSHF